MSEEFKSIIKVWVVMFFYGMIYSGIFSYVCPDPTIGQIIAITVLLFATIIAAWVIFSEIKAAFDNSGDVFYDN